MQLNKCNRCGAFFMANGNICPNCEPKDNNELAKLKNYLAEVESASSIESLSYNTGISVRNLNRFLNNDSLMGFEEKLNNINLGNIEL